jgi:hypothetical protein
VSETTQGRVTGPEAVGRESQAPPSREALRRARHSLGEGGRPWAWPLLAALLAVVPFAGMFSFHRIFHLRDLTLFFWGRYLWLRHSLWSGAWPLWDPYVGGGQSAVADALHQMFLLPALLVRLVGTEVMGFNLWVALPFPLAALGTYAFFRSRFSAPGAALGAIVFAVSGPVVSSGNFPNLSWSIAAMPWVLWAADRLVATARARTAALLAVAAACQALAGEPVSMAATFVAAIVFAIWPARENGDAVGAGLQPGSAAWRVLAVAGALLLGSMAAAVQVVPMAAAVSDSWRPYSRMTDFWSFHPLGLVETVSLQVFGNYLDATLLSERPWMVALNSGRDPFFYSVYLGPAVLALAVFGAVASARRRWTWFWVLATGAALVAAFGAFTPVYPFLQAHVPLLRSFRYPVKYVLVAALAVAALAASAWDAFSAREGDARAHRRYVAGMTAAIGLPAVLALVALMLAGWPLWNAHAAARWYYDIAVRIGAQDPVGCAAYALREVPHAALRLLVPCLVVSSLLVVHWKRATRADRAKAALFAVVAWDLVVAAWGINPTFDVRLAQAPAWTRVVAAHPDTRFYMGGRGLYGTFVENDPDAAKSFVRPFGMTPVEGRSAMAIQSVFSPSSWRVRELFSYDLAVLWPRPLMLTHARFLKATTDERDRFLDRTAVRFRVVPPSAAPGRTPLAQLDYFQTLCLFDWGPGLTRAYVVPEQQVVPDVNAQIEGLFTPGFDARRTVLTPVKIAFAAGTAGTPGQAAARIVDESSNRVLLDATAGPMGGFLVLLDTFSPDWTATVDGQPAAIYRANALFRTVPLVPGTHRVEFRYRPWSFQVGGAISLAGVLGILLLLRRPRH